MNILIISFHCHILDLLLEDISNIVGRKSEDWPRVLVKK
jgi:hypothetical protein